MGLFYRFPWGNNRAHHGDGTSIAGAAKRFSVQHSLVFDVLKSGSLLFLNFFFPYYSFLEAISLQKEHCIFVS